MLKFQELALRQNEWTPSTKVFSETSFLVIFERFVLIRRRHSFVPAKKRKCSNSGNFFNPGLQRMRGFFGLDLPSRNVLKKELPQHQPSSAMEMNAFQCEDISIYKPPYLKTHLSSTNRTHLLYDKLFTKAPHLSFWNITYFRFTCPNFPTSAICFWCTHSNKGKCATWEYPPT